ncbi:MAG: ATP-binding protein [Spirochaetaceae bacterium]|jgi:hypothetical protein|nr:ATP-binding protein [Spirochaetaceae bacterium]
MHWTLADLVADITQNGIESGASQVDLSVSELRDDTGKAEFRFTVSDNGKGMNADELEKAKDPFFTDGVKHPLRKIGLGVPFLIQTAEQSGGGTEVKSEPGKGTTVTAWFDLNNIDTPPVGDIPGMFRSVLLFQGPGEIVLRRICRDSKRNLDYTVRKSEIVDAIGSLEDAGSLALLGQYLQGLEEE